MKNFLTGAGVVGAICYLAIIVLGIVGWVKNIFKLIDAPALAQWGGIEVVRILGIPFAPVGAIVGWF